MILETAAAKDCCGVIRDAEHELKSQYFEDAGVTVKISKSEPIIKESFSFVSKSRHPFSFQFESNNVSNSFINEFELSFDYPFVPEVLCVTPNAFDDFKEEEIPPELKNLIDFEEERHAKPNVDETQIGRAHV